MKLWRGGVALFWGTPGLFALLYGTRILPTQAGWVNRSWGHLGAGILLILASFAAFGLAAASATLMGLVYWRHPALRTRARRRTLAVTLGGVAALGVLAAYTTTT